MQLSREENSARNSRYYYSLLRDRIRRTGSYIRGYGGIRSWIDAQHTICNYTEVSHASDVWRSRSRTGNYLHVGVSSASTRAYGQELVTAFET